MGRRTPKASAGEELTHKLLQSVRETKAGQAARVTKIELNEVAQARQKSAPGRVGQSLKNQRKVGIMFSHMAN